MSIHDLKNETCRCSRCGTPEKNHFRQLASGASLRIWPAPISSAPQNSLQNHRNRHQTHRRPARQSQTQRSHSRHPLVIETE